MPTMTMLFDFAEFWEEKNVDEDRPRRFGKFNVIVDPDPTLQPFRDLIVLGREEGALEVIGDMAEERGMTSLAAYVRDAKIGDYWKENALRNRLIRQTLTIERKAFAFPFDELLREHVCFDAIDHVDLGEKIFEKIAVVYADIVRVIEIADERYVEGQDDTPSGSFSVSWDPSLPVEERTDSATIEIVRSRDT